MCMNYLKLLMLDHQFIWKKMEYHNSVRNKMINGMIENNGETGSLVGR